MQTVGDKMGELIDQMDYEILWYKWMTYICPNAKEQTEFKNMNKQEQCNYLKEKTDGR